MRGGKGLHDNPVELDCLSGPIVTNVVYGPHPVMGPGRVQRLLSDMHGETKLAVEDTHATGMIPMVMRNQEDIHLSNRMAVSGEPLLRLAATDASVHQQLHVPGLHAGAISVTAGIQGDDPHGNTLTARGRREHDRYRPGTIEDQPEKRRSIGIPASVIGTGRLPS